MTENTAVYLFTGHYGSGKTEAAVNFARLLRIRKPEGRIALLDMDIVNPFFRSADAEEFLREYGIRLEVPLYANTNVDMPSLPGIMGALIRDPDWDVVIDVGGDDMGARAVGCYSEDILKRENFRYFVVNPRRPFTDTPESAAEIFDEIQAVACVPASGIVNNANLLGETTLELIAEGLDFSRRLGALRNLPVAYSCVPEELAEEAVRSGIPGLGEIDVIPLRRTVK